MKLIKTILLSAFLFSAFAFKNAPGSEIYGTYGVSKNDPAKIELQLNPDKTFSYTYFDRSDKIVKVQGEWEADDNVVILKNYPSDLSFHTKWKITDNGTVAKSRKGLNFYRLVKL